MFFNGLNARRGVCLETHVAVPENGDNLHEHNLIVERNEIEVEELNCRPNFIICHKNVRKFTFEFLSDVIWFVAL